MSRLKSAVFAIIFGAVVFGAFATAEAVGHGGHHHPAAAAQHQQHGR